MKIKKKQKINGRYHLNCINCGSLFWSPDAWKQYCPKCSYLNIDKLRNNDSNSRIIRNT